MNDVSKLKEDEKECVICLEDYKNEDYFTNLPCAHFFHTKCIVDWLKRTNDCPICKYKIQKSDFE